MENKERVPFKYRFNRTILIRALVLTVIFGFAMFIPLAMKLYDISIQSHDELEQRALDQQTRSYAITPGRGSIYDRNGVALAMSASVETVCVSPRDVTEEKEAVIADGLSSLLGVDREIIVEKMAKKNRANEKIKEQVEKETADKVREFINDNKLTNMVFLEPASKRYYPNGSLASNILGFVGVENSGLMGLEAVYNKTLSGTPGRTVTARTADGVPLPEQYEMYYDAQEGQNLILTIDETIQHFVEKHLETAVIENKIAKRGCVIAMDPNTGAILAMATKGDFDLNEPFSIADDEVRNALGMLPDEEYSQALSEAQQSQWRNKAINDTYEPGSVFKVFTAAMALEENSFNPESKRFVCDGSVHVGGHTIRCHKAGGHGSQTFLESLLHSCNPAFIAIGNAVGPENFYKYMKAFGFMDATGIDLQGEAKGIVSSYEAYAADASAQAVYSFGQTFKVTPIQMVTALSSLANGGYLMKPHLISEVTDSEGRTVEKAEATVVRQVVSSETSATMRAYMEQCVLQGTGSNAYVKGYRVAGKTGTSQKRDIPDASEKGLYVVSFGGFAPADNPQIAVLVMLDEPGLERSQRMGGYMAAPVAGKIIADVLPHLGVAPQYTEAEAMTVDVTVPFVMNAAINDAKRTAEQAGLKVRIVGEGASVTDQLPVAGVFVPANTEMILYTAGAEKPADTVIVPSVIGETPEKANEILTNAGVFMRPIGAQTLAGTSALKAAWQESAGEEVPFGTVIQVEFRKTDVRDE